MKNYYEEIDKVLKKYEDGKLYNTKSITWVCDRIDWCTKWKKITKEQTDELANRVVEVLK